jgi:hypothetical protein
MSMASVSEVLKRTSIAEAAILLGNDMTQSARSSRHLA